MQNHASTQVIKDSLCQLHATLPENHMFMKSKSLSVNELWCSLIMTNLGLQKPTFSVASGNSQNMQHSQFTAQKNTRFTYSSTNICPHVYPLSGMLDTTNDSHLLWLVVDSCQLLHQTPGFANPWAHICDSQKTEKHVWNARIPLISIVWVCPRIWCWIIMCSVEWPVCPIFRQTCFQ